MFRGPAGTMSAALYHPGPCEGRDAPYRPRGHPRGVTTRGERTRTCSAPQAPCPKESIGLQVAPAQVEIEVLPSEGGATAGPAAFTAAGKNFASASST
jgi:hypothetical protein